MNPTLQEAALSCAGQGMSVIALEWPTATGCSCPKGAGWGKSAGKHPRIVWIWMGGTS